MADRIGDLARLDDYAPDAILPPPYRAPGQGSRAARVAAGLLTAPAMPFIYAHDVATGKVNPMLDDTEAADWAAQTAFGLTTRAAGRAMPNTLTAGGGSKIIIPQEAPGGMGSLMALDRPYGTVARPAASPSQRTITSYVGEPQRIAFPGVYKRPDVIAAEGAANVAPEHPALKQLFGVTRQDLYDIGEQGRRQGNIDPTTLIAAPPARARDSYVAQALMNPKNAQRMVDTLAEAQKYPQLTRGMDAWYVMDPAFQRMVQLVGRDQAIKDYQRFNMTVPPFSAASDVMTEINRGTAANMFAARGDYPTFMKYGGVPEGKRALDPNFPPELLDVKGHAYHRTAQATPVERYLATGSHGYDPDSVKVSLYAGASGVPETGFQTRLPVPDAHFARASGVGEVRKSEDFGKFMGGTEYRDYGPWYRENVAKPLGIEAVPAQARMWGTYAPQTGVETPVGAPKLELLAQSIWDRAQRLGINPEDLRDKVLMGQEHANILLPGAGAAIGAGVMGSIADQSNYQQ